MSDYTISIPDTLYEKAQRVAQQTSRQVDDVIRSKLEGALDEPLFDLPDDEKEELKAMAYCLTIPSGLSPVSKCQKLCRNACQS